MKNRTYAFLASFFLLGMSVYADVKNKDVENAVRNYLDNYSSTVIRTKDRYKLERYTINDKSQVVAVYISKEFAYQPFTPQSAVSITDSLSAALPAPYNQYQLEIYTNKQSIFDLIPNYLRKEQNERMLWGKTNYKGNPWVKNASAPFTPSQGLENKHLALWASHGRYFKQATGAWEWQRPFLFTTTEDLFTPTIVVPYLIPMLEKAGAVVFTPRERDWQKHEVIVDNDTTWNGLYKETNEKFEWETCPKQGFAQRKAIYFDGENPFADGTTRQANVVNNKRHASTISWTPSLPQEGDYAVYVAYSTLPNSVPDAHYTVRHQGQETVIKVNQQMGGGTWVYLGTFHFDKGQSPRNAVTLNNVSGYRGVVTADAVRFGGGMGNIARGNNFNDMTLSGMARCFEGARYYAQWAGMPYAVYSSKMGQNDYADDINTRSMMSNYLAAGSVYNPCDTAAGLKVPIDLSLAIHSDAGISTDHSIIGSLSIYTTDNNGGRLSSGVSRSTSRDFDDMLLTQVTSDLTHIYGGWTRRQMWDRNYSETRVPEVPSAILETLSHQNFDDMRFGMDPTFRFHLARAIYKAVLRYEGTMHQEKVVVQPLPVNHFAALLKEQGKVHLSWKPQSDSLEESAQPSAYIVYTKMGDNDYNNGTLVKDCHLDIDVPENVICSFKVTAVNDGGESFPSEELSVMQAANETQRVLIVNGFDRVSAPAIEQTDYRAGFDLDQDPGIPYMRTIGVSGRQLNYNVIQSINEGAGEGGYCGDELQGNIYMGNTFNYPRVHGESIQMCPGYSFASCSRAAFEQMDVNEAKVYSVLDLIMGAQKDDPQQVTRFKTFTPKLQERVQSFTQQGGDVMLTGAYVGSDMQLPSEADFAANVLKYHYVSLQYNDSIHAVSGMGTSFSFRNQLNESIYPVCRPNIIMPAGGAFTTLLYSDSQSAAIAYKGPSYHTFVMAVPFECIEEQSVRHMMMKAILAFFNVK